MEEGKTYEVECPFFLEPYTEMNEDGYSTSLSWRPGIKWEAYSPEDAEPVCHGIGMVQYTIVSIHKLPRPYPPRVFFTRRFVSPDGRSFGKGRLHVMTSDAFRRRLKAYKPAGVGRYDGIRIVSLTEEEKSEMVK